MYGYGYGDMPFTVEDLAALKRQSMLSSAGGLLNQQMKGAYDSATQGLKDAVANYGTQYNAYKSNYDTWKGKVQNYQNFNDQYVTPTINDWVRQANGSAMYATPYGQLDQGISLPNFMYSTTATQPDPAKLTQAQINQLWATAPTESRAAKNNLNVNSDVLKWWSNFAKDQKEEGAWRVAGVTKPEVPTTVAPTIAKFTPTTYTPTAIDPSISAFMDKGINQELRKVKTQDPGTPAWLSSAKGAKIQSRQADDMIASYNTQQQNLARTWNLPNTNYGSAYSQWSAQQAPMSSATQAYVGEWDKLANMVQNKTPFVWSDATSPMLMYQYGTYKAPNGITYGTWNYRGSQPSTMLNDYMTRFLTPTMASIKSAVGLTSSAPNSQWMSAAASKPTLTGYAPNAASYYAVPAYQQVATPDQSYLNKVRRIQEMQTRLGG